MYVREEFHWKEAISTFLTLLAGIGFLVSGFIFALSGTHDQVATGILNILGGIALLVISIIAFNITDGWKRASELSTGKKIIAYLPVLITGISLIFFIAFFYILLFFLKQAFGTRNENSNTLNTGLGADLIVNILAAIATLAISTSVTIGSSLLLITKLPQSLIITLLTVFVLVFVLFVGKALYNRQNQQREKTITKLRQVESDFFSELEQNLSRRLG